MEKRLIVTESAETQETEAWLRILIEDTRGTPKALRSQMFIALGI
jgi:hypothetical protein